MTVRRIVTGHNADGKAVIAADEAIEGRGLAEDAGRRDATFFQLWATHEMPVDLTDAALARQREGSETTILGTGSGSVLRIGVLEPGARSPMHRTESLDYGICLEGECDMELDSGEVVTVRAGRCRRPARHQPRLAQPQRRSVPLRVDRSSTREPVMVGGRRLGTSWGQR